MTRPKSTSPHSPLFTVQEPPRRAALLGLQVPGRTHAEVRASLEELEQLATGLGIEVVQRSIQKRHAVGSPGSGKLRELARLVAGEPAAIGPDDDAGLPPRAPVDDLELASDDGDVTTFEGDAALDGTATRGDDTPRDGTGAPEREAPLAAAAPIDLVIVDAELGPTDLALMEHALGVEVMCRTGVVLRVFETRAQTREARLETEIARLHYESARVRDTGVGDDRRGGGGRGGRGHTNVELRKRALRERAQKLRRELDASHTAQAARRTRRAETPSAALVGYTNAGKSTWMRALTGSEVLVEDRLFATLGTTVRVLQPDTQPRVVLSDTVGFIRNLPHSLVASFRATLDEARHAGLLLLVVDASDPDLASEVRVTREVLREIGADDVPSLMLLNKSDRVSAERAEELALEHEGALLVSAYDPRDVAMVRERIRRFFEQRMVEAHFEVPYEKLALVGRIHERARVLAERYTETGAVLHVRGFSSAVSQLARALVE